MDPHGDLHSLLSDTFPHPDDRSAVEWLSMYTSAHGDLVERLEEVVGPLQLALWHPDGDFPFFVVSDVDGRIVGAAVGMNSIYVKVRERSGNALEPSEPAGEIGPDWHRFDAFDVDLASEDLVRRLRGMFQPWARGT